MLASGGARLRRECLRSEAETQRDDCADRCKKVSKHDGVPPGILLVAPRRCGPTRAAPGPHRNGIGKMDARLCINLLFPSREHGTKTTGDVGPLISEILPFGHV